ncbi:MAG TPA: tetratricopeptide repeat protein [Pirellulaceae bacterium]|nr:tetratricopeptide repeat protein [Pirellulaceae bacterium]HMO92847.1 tetratricopeptide repeat protein [Pirellulaceae bacterium]HMP69411.1 tetratricopeptide repeat protein [Pirellulaceae bacterium]
MFRRFNHVFEFKYLRLTVCLFAMAVIVLGEFANAHVLGNSSTEARSPAILQDERSNHGQRIAAIFEQTKTANSAKDYGEIISAIDSLLQDAELSANNRTYLNSLKAWAHDHRGYKRSELIDLFRTANNHEQANLAVAQSIEDFQMAIELDPQRWQARMHRGIVFAKSADFDAAANEFTEVIRLEPSNTSAFFNRAECLYQLRRYEEALVNYNHVLNVSPGDIQVVTGRAHTLMQMGRFDEALEDYQIVVRIRPNDGWAFANRGELYAEVGNWKLAYNDYNKAIEIKPDADIYRRIAWLLATCPDEEFYRPQTAIELARKAIDMGGVTASRLDTLAACLASAGYFDEAKVYQKQAIDLLERQEYQTRMALYENGEPFMLPARR